MTVQEVANKLVEINRSGNWMPGYDLYSDDAISIERPFGGEETRLQGKEAILKMAKEWDAQNNVTSEEVSDPVVADTCFAVTFHMTMKDEEGNEQKMSELGIYHVQDGKIIQAEFCYAG